ncbi:hypothetical protein GCM10022377_09990 [Zhihengliuella alba]|uniref:Uncharacterized protein n=1 Tax=Zhihengliuella alba TaxID=547018 RepID=A0ABP7D0H9_9MICC
MPQSTPTIEPMTTAPTAAPESIDIQMVTTLAVTVRSSGRKYAHFFAPEDITHSLVDGVKVPSRCGTWVGLAVIPGTGGRCARPSTPTCPGCALLEYFGLRMPPM